MVLRNCYIDLCPVTPGVWYDVEATFSEADDDGYMTTTIVVSFNGDFRRKTMRSLALPLDRLKIYNLRDGQVLVGGLELEYDEVPQIGAVDGDGNLSMAELAEHYGFDLSKDGQLKPFARGELDKSFEAAAFALEPGALSGVVDTPSGLHLILRLS